MVCYTIPNMAKHLTAQQVEEVPHGAAVSDFDELADDQQQTLHELLDGEFGGQVDESLDGTIVRFTDYYRLRVAGMRASD